MNPFVAFMVSPAGRVLRIVAGLGLIGWGLLGAGGAVGIALAVLGVVPLAAGALDLCVFAPLFGGPLQGARIRRGR